MSKLAFPAPGTLNESAAIPGEESRPISVSVAPQRRRPYTIVRSRPQHISGGRQQIGASPIDPDIVVQRIRVRAR